MTDRRSLVLAILAMAIALSIALGIAMPAFGPPREGNIQGADISMDQMKELDIASAKNSNYELATFAGGCFWCLQPSYDKLHGVIKTVVGYTGGAEKDPTYDEVAHGRTGHVEAIRILYDPQKVKFEELVEEFWRNIDPTQADGQFADRGPQYRTVIFYHDDNQKAAAEKAKAMLEESGKFKKPIATRIQAAGEFYQAEEYHQEYYKKNEAHYRLYKIGSGRADFIEKVWGEEVIPKK